ncbi:hypothetical protein RND81_07G061800 [Saponaria officinalis]|uniref:Uncharacterized protein n=1 Tax=Saponaria officinalis TaxID=3572 RepID=A0AAW1JNR5_SAPOF
MLQLLSATIQALIPILHSMQRPILLHSPLLNPISLPPLSPLVRFPQFRGTLHSNPLPNPLLYSSLTPASTLSTSSSPDEDDFEVLTATRSEYNNIIILESHNSKVLLLDDSCNVHSILYKDKKWTNSYWDEFTSLPAIIPPGPIAVFGLGGGTIAHQLLHFWPSLSVHGWELDEVLIDRARQFFGLSEIESENEHDGILFVNIGDALSPLASIEHGYAGIVVDLFSNAKVLPELEKAETWVEMKKKLMAGGRIMVNCGGEISSVVNNWEVNLTIQAMCEAFGRNLVNWKKMPENESGNYLAFTGPLPDIDLWSSKVPQKLAATVSLWRACEPQ